MGLALAAANIRNTQKWNLAEPCGTLRNLAEPCGTRGTPGVYGARESRGTYGNLGVEHVLKRVEPWKPTELVMEHPTQVGHYAYIIGDLLNLLYRWASSNSGFCFVYCRDSTNSGNPGALGTLSPVHLATQ